MKRKLIGSLFLIFFVWLFLFILKTYKADQDHLEKVEENITNAYISGKATLKALSRYIENKKIYDQPHLILKLIRNTLQHGLSPKEKIFFSSLTYIDEKNKITPIGISKAPQVLPIVSKSNEIDIHVNVKTNNQFTGKLTAFISLDAFMTEVRSLGYNITVIAKPQNLLIFNISLNIQKRILRLFNNSIYDHLLIIFLLFSIYISLQKGALNTLNDNVCKQNTLLKEKEKTYEMYRQKEKIHNYIFQYYFSSIDQIKIYKKLFENNDPAFSQNELVDKINQILDDLQSLKFSTLESDEFTLKECVEKAIVSFYQEISQKELSIHTHFMDCDISLKQTNQNILLLLIVNLLNQSIERLPKNGKIHVYLNADKNCFLKIKDNGYSLKLPDNKAPFTRGETIFSLNQNFLKAIAQANSLQLEHYLENDTHITKLGEAERVAIKRPPLKIVR